MTVRLEKLAVDLVANGEKFKAELAKSQTSAERWGRRVSGAVAGGAGALVAATAAAAALTVKTIRMADEIAKNSKAAGVGAETFQSWEFAASQAGVSNDKFAISMERATKRIGEAARGFGGAKKTLDDYNISVFDSRGNIRTTEDVVREFADTLKGMETAAERTAAVTALFGREGIRMGLVFGQGNEVLEQFEEQARTLGLVIDRGVLEKAEKANDQLDIMQRIIKARLITSMSNLFPTVIAIGNSFAAATPKMIEFIEASSNLLFNTEKAGINNRIQSAKKQLKELQGELRVFDQFGESGRLGQLGRDAQGPAFNPFDNSDLAKARIRKNLEQAIEFRKELIEGGHKELASFETKIAKQSADLINAESLLIGGAGGGGSGNDGVQGGKTFEELQADAAEAAYARRFESAREFSTNIYELTDELIEKDRERIEASIAAEKELRDAKIEVAQGVFSVVGNLAKEGSKAQRVLFAAEKAAGLAQSIIALQTAIAKANALGFPANIPAIAQAVSIGAGAISTIKSVNLQGVAHAGLTNVPREGTYLLDGDERVLKPEQNRDLTQFLKGQAAENHSMQVKVQVIEDGRRGGEVQQDGDMVRIFVERVRSALRDDMRQGRGFGRDLEASYTGLRRRTV